MTYDPIIFGKQNKEGIVSVEIKDNTTELFVQQLDGSIKSEFVPHKWWLVSDMSHGSSWIKLKGKNHYQYGCTFDNKEDWQGTKGFLKYKKQQDIFSVYNAKEQFLIKSGHTYFKGLKHNQLSVLSFDIETDGLHKTKDSRVFLISNTFRDSKGNIEKRLFCYDNYENDGAMIEDWSMWVRDKNPTVLLGHNINVYDLPYMQHVADLHEVTIDIGRDRSPLAFESYESKFRKDQTQVINYYKPIVYGREIVDTFFLSIKYDTIFKEWSSLSLKTIIKETGLEQPGRTFYDASLIRKNIFNPIEREKIKAYCNDDATDALNLYDKLCPTHFYITQSVPKSYQAISESASGSQINSMMLRNYLQYGEAVPKGDSKVKFPGATSLGYSGIYKNVKKLDVQSLYPNIMLQYEINNLVKDPKNHLLYMLNYFTEQRLVNKKLAKETGDKYYENIEQSAKVFINSSYGFLGSPSLNFNDIELAAKVTEIGRGILSTSMNWAKQKGFILTSIDTDSIAFCKPDQSPMSEEEQELLRLELNTLYPDRIRFMDDGYFLSSIVFGAKNYVLYNPGKKLKTKGSALKSSTLEKGSQQFLQEVVQSILNDRTDYLDIYNKYIKMVCNITDKETMRLWSSKKTISNTTLASERANETKIVDAIAGTEYVVGDKVWLFYKEDESLSLVEHFDGKYDKLVLVEKLWKVSQRFSEVLSNIEFPKYHLKKNKGLLEGIINGIS